MNKIGGNLLSAQLKKSHLVSPPQKVWKILVADNEEEIHVVTRMVLQDFFFENIPFQILSSYGEEDTKRIIEENPDLALVLLDVVMDTDRSGLDLVRYIRNELKNPFLRIILRTGQPGSAPESKVIIDYDIDDYREKTELTAQKLRTTVITALRAFRDLQKIDEDQKKLETYQTFLGQILQSISSAIIVLDNQYIPTVWNQAAEIEMRLDPSALQPIWEYKPYLNNAAAYIRKCMEKRERYHSSELFIESEDEEYRDLTIYPLDSPLGEGLVIRIDDVTIIKKKDAQLQRSQKLDAVGSLSAGLAHDINNILGGITGSIALIDMEKEDSPGLHNSNYDMYLSTIKDAADRAANLVKQLLSLTRKSDILETSVDLNEVVQKVLRLCESSFEKTVELYKELSDEPAVITADPAAVEQVLLNLCINGAHAMTVMRSDGEVKGGRLSVSLKRMSIPKILLTGEDGEQANDWWRICISDNGVGMTPAVIDQMFNPFFTTKAPGSGTGLGLAMVYNIVSQFDGRIDVQSVPGEGTRFYLYFPVAEKVVENPIEKSDHTRIKGQGTILLCDDEELMRTVGSRILDKCGYNVLLAKDGEESVSLYKENQYQIDAVILDIQMPKLSGLDVYQRLNQINPNVKVLLSSGYRDEERIEQALNAGVRDFLQKPYTMEKLTAALKMVMEG